MSFFKGLRIEKNGDFDHLKSLKSLGIPIKDEVRENGNISFENDSIYISEDGVWKKIASQSGGDGNTIKMYEIFLGKNKTINPSVDTVLTDWSFSEGLENQGWDISSGKYTSTKDENMLINVSIVWEEGISNAGSRITRLILERDSQSIIVKEFVSQPSTNLNFKTYQSFNKSLSLKEKDQICFSVEQDSKINLEISNETTISGIII